MKIFWVFLRRKARAERTKMVQMTILLLPGHVPGDSLVASSPEGEAAQWSFAKVGRVKQIEAPVHLFERDGIGIDFLKHMRHVLEFRDGASRRMGKERGVAVMLKSCSPAEALSIQDILRFCCRSDSGKKDLLN